MESDTRPAKARKTVARTPVTPNAQKAVCRLLPSVCRAAGPVDINNLSLPVLRAHLRAANGNLKALPRSRAQMQAAEAKLRRLHAKMLVSSLLQQRDCAGLFGLSCEMLLKGVRIKLHADPAAVQAAIHQLLEKNFIQPTPVVGGKYRLTDKGRRLLQISGL